MPPKKSESSRWCFLRDNPQLRGLILYIQEKKGYTSVDLAKMIDCDPDRVCKYLRHDPKYPGLSQLLLVKLADKLGIELKLDVKLKKYE